MIKRLAPDVLSHRIILEARARAEGRDGRSITRQVLEHVPVPVEFEPAEG